MSKEATTIQMTKADKLKVKELCDKLTEEYGYRIGYRIAVMIAINKMLKEGNK